MTKDKKRPKKNTQKTLEDIVNIFKEQPKKRYNAANIAQKLAYPVPTQAVEAYLQTLVQERKVRKHAGEKYSLVPHEQKQQAFVVEGVVDMTKRGSAFIVSETLKNDILVSARDLLFALDGDRVRVECMPRRKPTQRPEGRVVQVLQRGRDAFIGTLHLSAKYAFVVPDLDNMPVDIFVPLENTAQAITGQKVVVKILKWHDEKNRNPVGKVTKILGMAGSSDIEMQSILLENGFDLEFSDEVLAEAAALNDTLTSEELATRRDFRGITTFTIDPDTAKDFDDALSLRYLPNEHYEIGVHIADVAHFVKPDTELDKEAFKRSTSVYLVDRALPMLPEHLSNELCSLRPHEDKFTFSAVFTFDKNFNVVEKWFGRTLIHSNRRFTYEEAQQVLETNNGDYVKELTLLNKIAHKLRKQRYKNGAITFEMPEAKFVLAPDGTPLSVQKRERKDAHMLVEDFMLLANKEVATFIATKTQDIEVPYIYRIHDTPDPDKLTEFSLFAAELGYKLSLKDPAKIAKSLNDLTKEAAQRPELQLLLPLAIRTMAKAAYSTARIGHYGLAFEHYAHFTSPIRRYSDVLAHRLLYLNLQKTYITDATLLEQQCKHISAQERKAMEAERESVKYKQAEYIRQFVGKEFQGRISGMTERSLFVELGDTLCEGVVPISELDEPFRFDSRLKTVGTVTGRIIRFGDPITVVVKSVNLERRQVELTPVERS